MRLRWFLYILAHLQHFFSSVYFALVGTFMYYANAGDASVLHAYSKKSSAIIFFVMAALHALPLFRLIRPRYRIFYNTKSAVQAHDLTYASWIRSDLSVVFNHLSAVLCETYIAYEMSLHLTWTNVAYCYTLLLVANCLFTPWFFLIHTKCPTKFWFSLVDCQVSFMLSVGCRLCFFAIPLIFYQFNGTFGKSNDYTWSSAHYAPTQLMIITSPVEIPATIIPSLCTLLTLHRLICIMELAQCIESQTKLKANSIAPTSELINESKPQTLCFIFPRPRITYEKVKNSLLVRVFLGFNFCHGLIILSIATFAVHRQTSLCPSTCVHDSRPWLTLTCNCIYANFDCGDASEKLEMESNLTPAAYGSNVLFLSFQRCKFPHGVNATVLKAFPKLLGVRIEFSEMIDWNESSADLPSSIALIEIRYSNLTQVPAILHPPGKNVVRLSLVGAQIHDIPDQVWVEWQQLNWLYLGNNALTSFPNAVLTLPSLIALGLDHNNISTIALNASPTWTELAYLGLDSNAITQFPRKLVQALPTTTIYLDDNPIATDDVVHEEISTSEVELAQTPYCLHQIISTTCPNLCSTGCAPYHLGNSLCDLACNVSSCAFDGGDCLV